MIGMGVKEVETGDKFTVVSEPFLESETRRNQKYTQNSMNIPDMTAIERAYSILLVSTTKGVFKKVDLDDFTRTYISMR